MEIHTGLDHVFSDVPVGRGSLELDGGLSSQTGIWGSLDAQLHLTSDIAVFGRGEISDKDGQVNAQVLAGVRMNF